MRLPNGYGSIHKLSGNRRKPYRVRITTGWDNNGKQKFLTVGYYETKQEALIGLSEYHKNPFTEEQKEATLEQVYNKWSKIKYEKVSRSTVITYTSVWKHCEPIKDIPFIDIKLHHLQAIADSLGDRAGQKEHLKHLFNQLYDYAIKNDMPVKKYSTYVEIDSTDRKLERKPFTEEEINILWKNIDRMKYIDMLLVYIYTGFRPGELLEITKKDVNLEEGYLKGGIKTKASKNRIVPIHHRIMPIIEKWYNRDNDYLFYNNQGKQMKYRNWKDEIMGKICEQLNMEHLPHDTRHTFATRMDNVGANKLCIKRIMGHQSTDITDKVYTHKDIEELKKAIELLP